MSHDVPANLGVVFDEDSGAEPVLHLMVLPDGRPVTLRGTAATIWALALESDDVVGDLATMVGRPRDEIAPETEEFLADLVLQRFLVPGSDAATDEPIPDAPAPDQSSDPATPVAPHGSPP